jgi:hypothetical protein
MITSLNIWFIIPGILLAFPLRENPDMSLRIKPTAPVSVTSITLLQQTSGTNMSAAYCTQPDVGLWRGDKGRTQDNLVPSNG